MGDGVRLPAHFCVDVVFHPEECIERDGPYMCLTVHIISDIFQGGLDGHLRLISVTEQVQAFRFCVICGLHFDRNRDAFIIGDEVDLCVCV